MNPDPLYVAEDAATIWTDGFDTGYTAGRRRAPPPVIGLLLAALAGAVIGALLLTTAQALAASPGSVEFPARPSPEASRGHDASLPPASPAIENGLARMVLPPDPISPPADSLRGIASWFPASGMIAAAGPALRTGDWRGSTVTVRGNGRSVTVRLTDWCRCPQRLIDLSDDAFRELAPLSRGLVRVTIDQAAATLPPTDQ